MRLSWSVWAPPGRTLKQSVGSSRTVNRQYEPQYLMSGPNPNDSGSARRCFCAGALHTLRTACGFDVPGGGEFLGFLLGIVLALALRFMRYCSCSSESSTHSYVFWCPATRPAISTIDQPNEGEIAPREVDPVENQPGDQNGCDAPPSRDGLRRLPC